MGTFKCSRIAWITDTSAFSRPPRYFRQGLSSAAVLRFRPSPRTPTSADITSADSLGCVASGEEAMAPACETELKVSLISSLLLVVKSEESKKRTLKR